MRRRFVHHLTWLALFISVVGLGNVFRVLTTTVRQDAGEFLTGSQGEGMWLKSDMVLVGDDDDEDDDDNNDAAPAPPLTDIDDSCPFHT